MEGRQHSQQSVSDSANGAPACDQCRLRKVRCDRATPRCSNCAKADADCIFSGRGKRTNHTKQLVEDFSGLASRLESIESSIGQLQRQTQAAPYRQLGSSSPSDMTASAESTDFACFVRGPFHAGSYLGQGASGQAWHLGQVQHKVHDGDVEYFYGLLDTVSIFESFRNKLRKAADRLEHALTDQTLGTASSDANQLRDRARDLDTSFPSNKETPVRLASPSQPNELTCPPQALLNACLEIYLAEFNTVWPVFDPGHLRSVVEQHYQYHSPSPQDEAWNLCFTNIILLVQGLQLRLSKVNSVIRRDLDDNLWQFFLQNARRGVNRLPYLSQHWLVNVQALVTLALVAGEFWERAAHQKIVHVATYLIRAMGLHQAPRPDLTANANPIMTRERVQLFWTLYSMDTERSLLSGHPCDIYLFDADLSLLDIASSDPSFEDRQPRLHILAIMEEAYVQLYTPRAFRLDESSRQGKVANLVTELKVWAQKNKQLLDKPQQNEATDMTLARVELMYYHDVADLLLRGYSSVAHSSSEQRVSARRALRFIGGLATQPISPKAFVLLGRLLRYYPMLPFHTTLDSILQQDNAQADQDMELLDQVAEAVHMFLYPSGSTTYYRDLYEGMRWCIGMKPTYMAIGTQMNSLAAMSPACTSHSGGSHLKRSLHSTPEPETHASERRGNSDATEENIGTKPWNFDFGLSKAEMTDDSSVISSLGHSVDKSNVSSTRLVFQPPVEQSYLANGFDSLMDDFIQFPTVPEDMDSLGLCSLSTAIFNADPTINGGDATTMGHAKHGLPHLDTLQPRRKHMAPPTVFFDDYVNADSIDQALDAEWHTELTSNFEEHSYPSHLQQGESRNHESLIDTTIASTSMRRQVSPPL